MGVPAKMGATWTWIGRREQRRIIEMCIMHLKKVLSVAEALRDMINAHARGDKENTMEHYQRVFKAEREADDIKKKILAELSRGVFHPIDREDLVRLLLSADDIADYLKASSRRLILVEPGRVPGDIVEVYEKMINKILEAIEVLIRAVETLYITPSRSLELADTVERIEEEVDDIRMHGLEKVLKWCEKTSIAECVLSKEIVDTLETATDNCENVGDVIRSISLLNL